MGKFDKSTNMATDIIFNFIKKRMKEKGISQYKLAEMIGINESTLIRNFKKDTEMSLPTFLKICGALDVRPYLVNKELDDNELDYIHFN